MTLRSVLLVMCLAVAPTAAIAAVGATAAGVGTSADSIPAAHRVQPAELAKTLQDKGAKPLVLQVGSRLLYTQAHIPGAEYVGAAGQEAGLDALGARAQKLDRAQPIVIYCGCCPWTKCPNVGRAYDKLVGMGFTHVQVLYIAENFGADWVDKGFPVAKGDA